MKPDTVHVTCSKCGMTMPVPVGGKRLCGCGTWISGSAAAATAIPIHAVPLEATPVFEPEPVATSAARVPTARPAASSPARPAVVVPANDGWPKIEGDLAAIER